MSDRDPRLGTNGNGYEQIRAARSDGSYAALNHHRVLMFAWGRLDSPFFSEDAREVHHETGVEWCNIEPELSAVTPWEHMEIDDGRAQIRTPWNELGSGQA